MATLIERYLDNDPDIIACYNAPIDSLYESKPEARPWDTELVGAIREFNAALDHHPEFNGDEAVIITGQQPAIFAGPLYSVYKAITTLQLAERLTELSGSRVVPVFWVGSEDHDFKEAATVYYPTRSHTTEAITLPKRDDFEGKALHQVPITDDFDALIETLSEHGPGGEHREEICAFLHQSASESTSLSDWSTRILARFFCDTPLVFFAPHISAARKASVPVIRHAIEYPLTTTQAVNAGAERLESLGYTAQVEKNDTECAFFYETGGVRAKVTFDNDLYHLPEIRQSKTREELLDDLKRHPERFSPNVALRCIVQQALFPVAAYVAGPGELMYWGQFKGVFDSFDAKMPVVYPRAHAVLTNTKLNKLSAKYNLLYEELFAPDNDLLQRCLRSGSDPKEIALFNESRNQLLKVLGDLKSNLNESSATGASMVQTLIDDVNRKIDRLENHLLRADDTRRKTVEAHVERLRNMLAPNRKPQERMHSVVPYLFEYGWALRERLIQKLTLGSTTVHEVEL